MSGDDEVQACSLGSGPHRRGPFPSRHDDRNHIVRETTNEVLAERVDRAGGDSAASTAHL
jgi:hypothetical protein